MVRPFRFGINVRTAGSAAEWADKARKVERLGYSVLLVPDHLAELLAPFPALAAAAAATTRLRVGTGVLNNDLRHPLLTAREAATLDVLSDGRSTPAPRASSDWRRRLSSSSDCWKARP